jgi:hypothetical protein
LSAEFFMWFAKNVALLYLSAAFEPTCILCRTGGHVNAFSLTCYHVKVKVKLSLCFFN